MRKRENTFIAETILRHFNLGDDPNAGIKAVRVPHRVKVGTKPLNIGQLDCFYIASATQGSCLIGRVDLPSLPELEFVPTESVSARKYIAQWLIAEAQTPFMIGVVSKAHPEESYRISEHLSDVHFCDVSGGFSVNVNLVRDAQARIQDLDWKKAVAPGIHLYHDYLHAEPGNNERARTRLQAHLEKHPALTHLLPSLGVLPGSGEYTILSWANIDHRT